MNPITRSSRTLLSTLLLGSLLGWGAVAHAQSHSSIPEPNRLQVQAQAELSVTPDMATLNARLWERTPAIAQREDAQTDPQALAEARERLEARSGELIRTLEEAGLDSKAIHAGSLSVRPDYIQAPQRDGESSERLVRTQLERPVTLRIENLDQLPSILDALTTAGVNSLDGVSYDLKDRDAATDRALTQALQRAHHKAQLMADALDVELGQVLNVHETNAPVFNPRMVAMSANYKESRAAPEYRPGEIIIEAGVNVAWEIEQ